MNITHNLCFWYIYFLKLSLGMNNAKWFILSIQKLWSKFKTCKHLRNLISAHYFSLAYFFYILHKWQFAESSPASQLWFFMYSIDKKSHADLNPGLICTLCHTSCQISLKIYLFFFLREDMDNENRGNANGYSTAVIMLLHYGSELVQLFFLYYLQ